jgi:protein-L-isoaspartate O-methyltransferase
MVGRRKLKWTLGLLAPLVLLAGLYATAAYRVTHPEPEISRLYQVLKLKAGMTVAEIGAGQGRMTVAMARLLAPTGRVFATELDAQLVRDIQNRAAKAGVQNVTVIEGTDRSTNLPAQCCDAIWMVTVYHHFTDPVAMDASLFRALRPGGRIAIIDFSPSRWRFWLTRPSGVPQNRGGHGIPKAIVIQELTSTGLRLDSVIDDWWLFPESRYCVVFYKP